MNTELSAICKKGYNSQDIDNLNMNYLPRCICILSSLYVKKDTLQKLETSS